MSRRRDSMRPWRPRCSISSQTARRVQQLDSIHQPQPPRDRADVRPGRRAVRGRTGRGRAGEPACSRDPRHPYTVGLMRCVPAYGRARTRDGSRPFRVSACSGIDHRPLYFVERCANATSAAAARRRRRSEPAGTCRAVSIPIGRRNCLASFARRRSRRHAAGAAGVSGVAARELTAAGVLLRRSSATEHCRKRTWSPASRSRRCMTSRSSFGREKRSAWSGESGSGKSSLAKLMLGLSTPDEAA